MSQQRGDHYYLLETFEEHEEGHIFCTPKEAQEIEAYLRKRMPADVWVGVELGGDYKYTTEEATAQQIAQDIARDSGFLLDEEEDD